MDRDSVVRAYTVLGLSPPVSKVRLNRRYKALVRRWHPDRYQNDASAQAEATQRLRDINIAYEVVAASVDSTEGSQVPQVGSADGAFSWSPERVQDVAESINRLNRLTLFPTMSLHRWLSVVALATYVLGAYAIFGENVPHERAVGRAVGAMLGYCCLPLFLIWSADHETAGSLERRLLRIIGWLLMSVPAVIATVLWIAG